MAQKQWRVIVSELGNDTPQHDIIVEAPNWVTALQRGRSALGERGGVPPGANCSVAPDGGVTITDPMARRVYFLRAAGPAVGESLTRAPISAPPLSGNTPISAPPASGASDPPEDPTIKTTAVPDGPVATTSVRSLSGVSPSSSASTSVAAASSASAVVPSEPFAELLSSRDQEPNSAAPLRYRERVYFRQDAMLDADEACTKFLHAELDKIQRALPESNKFVLVRLALFDHAWATVPDRAPRATLEWKSWTGEPSLTLGAQQPTAPQVAPAAQAVSSQAVATPLPPRKAASTSSPFGVAGPSDPFRANVSGEHDERLAQAFEALQDLLFLSTPVEGLDFVVGLLSSLIESEAISACLYDIDTDEFRFVAVIGPGAEERKAIAVPREAGLFAVTTQEMRPVRIANAGQDERFDPGVDGRLGLDVVTALYAPVTHEGRLLGVLQLLNRARHDYSIHDADLVAYISRSLGEFLHQAKLVSRKKKQ